MTRISSGATLFHKKIFPAIWFGCLGVFAALQWARSGPQDNRWAFIVIIVLMAVFGYFLMRKVIWELVDEVLDGGDFLLIRQGADEERVPLADIMNVDEEPEMSPERITLQLVKPGKFGAKVSFALPARFSFSSSKHPITEDLILRVDRARRRSD
jgi:hypothetical protein